MQVQQLLFLILSVLGPMQVENAKILGIFWTHSRSHHILGSHLLQEMAKRGHEVKLISSFIDNINITNLHQEQLDIEGLKDFMKAVSSPSAIPGGQLINLMTNLRLSAESFWENKVIKNLVESNEKFDLVLTIEFYNDAILGLAHHVSAPVIQFSPVGAHSLTHKFVGNPNMAYFPNPFFSESSGRTFCGRVVSAAMNCALFLLEYFVSNPLQDEMLRKNLPNSPRVEELQGNVSIVFVNSHFSIESPRPHVPNMIQIGGFHTKQSENLPNDLQKYFDAAKKGAILFSFGTNVKIGGIDPNLVKIIVKGLGKVAPVKVLFKSEVNLTDVPENILIRNWLPQNDVLGHPNIKLFISHGGLGGTTEAVHHGVPILGIPFFGDQRTNIAGTTEAGYSVSLERDSITQESFNDALQEVLRNPKYARIAKKYSSLLRNRPMNPLSLAIWWMEHIMEHKGGQHLRNMAMDLTWYQLYMIDIMMFYLVFLSVFVFSIIFATRYLFRKIANVMQGDDKKSN